MSNYPPMKTLLAFDAAMQHNSFALAARDLHVTPGAISQQIQRLEEWLGCSMFIRETRQIRPTAEAINYWASVQPALAVIKQASHTLRHRKSNEVWLSLPPTFAAKWFAPRMADLIGRHPQLSLHLQASSALVDFEREHIDLAIRYFDGSDMALDASLLFHDEAHLYCAPSYAEELRLCHPSDLARTTLLHTTLHPHWTAWLQRFAHMNEADIACLPGLYFNQTLLAIEAAKHGRGVMLSSPLLVQQDCQQGLLVEPFTCALPLPQSYYLVHPHKTELRPAVQQLKSWLQTMAD